jgi:hypothetical protein
MERKRNIFRKKEEMRTRWIIVKGSPASHMSWRCGYRGVPNGMEPVGKSYEHGSPAFADVVAELKAV